MWTSSSPCATQLQDAGITPFYGTLAENWTGLPSFNGLGAYPARTTSSSSCASRAKTSAPTRGVVLEGRRRSTSSMSCSPTRRRATAVAATTTATPLRERREACCAGHLGGEPDQAGESRHSGRDLPHPATDDPDDRLLVSGVDVVVTMGKDTPHPEEAMRFIEYLFEGT